MIITIEMAEPNPNHQLQGTAARSSSYQGDCPPPSRREITKVVRAGINTIVIPEMTPGGSEADYT